MTFVDDDEKQMKIGEIHKVNNAAEAYDLAARLSQQSVGSIGFTRTKDTLDIGASKPSIIFCRYGSTPISVTTVDESLIDIRVSDAEFVQEYNKAFRQENPGIFAEADELQKVTAHFLKSTLGMLTFARLNEDKQYVQTNGSFFVARSHTDLYFIVTASHVYEAYIKSKQENQRILAFLSVGSNVVIADLADRVISIGDEVDVAILKVSKEEIKELGITPLPICRVELKRYTPIWYGGYPRQAGQSDTDRSPFFLSNGFVDSVSPKTIIVALQLDRTQPLEHTLEVPKDFTSGGMSGGPAMVQMNRGGIAYWAACGVIYEGGQELSALFIHPTSLIDDDGRIVSS